MISINSQPSSLESFQGSPKSQQEQIEEALVSTIRGMRFRTKEELDGVTSVVDGSKERPLVSKFDCAVTRAQILTRIAQSSLNEIRSN